MLDSPSRSGHVVLASARQLVTVGTRGTSALCLSWCSAWLGRLLCSYSEAYFALA